LFARSDLAAHNLDLGSPATTDQIERDLAARFAGQPRLLEAARLHLATLETVLGHGAEAERVLSTLRSEEAQALRARVRLAAGDLAGARELAEGQLSTDPDDAGSLNLLAQIALTQGD